MHAFLYIYSQKYILVPTISQCILHKTVFIACMHQIVCTLRKQCIINTLKRKQCVQRQQIFNPFSWLRGGVHRILPCFESLLVSTGQIICIYFLCEQWETAGNHRCHYSIVNRELKVALVSLRCKSHANIINEWKKFTVWRSVKSIRSALFEWLLVVSRLCVSLFTDRAPVMFSHFSLLSVTNRSRVLSPLCEQDFIQRWRIINQPPACLVRAHISF